MDNNVNKRKYILIGLVMVLILSNLFFIFRSSSLSTKLAEKEAQTEISNRNEKMIEFMSLFVEKVLKSEKEIDFDTRLSLENSVRATKDQDLINQWQKFTNSKTEEAAQAEVKNLLGLVADKIKNTPSF